MKRVFRACQNPQHLPYTSIYKDMTTNQLDTITAIATPQGAGGIGIVRISGPTAWDIAKKLVSPFPKHPKPYQAFPTWLWPSRYPHRIDRGLLLLFEEPHSYTGEQTAELHLHGSQGVMLAAVQAAIENGARQAEPGEFTQRAFLNGRLDLAQAEAVADLIASRNVRAAEAAARQHHGDLSKRLTEFQAAIIANLSLFEAHIDFPDEMDEFASLPVEQELLSMATELEQLADQANRFRAVKDGIIVTIAGLPNAGKSSLLNALLGHKRAIVSDIAGTTRDMVSESMQIDGLDVRLQDTAGLRHSDDIIEQMGVDISKEAVVNCELCLYLIPAHWPIDAEQHPTVGLRQPNASLIVRSMDDRIGTPTPLPDCWQGIPEVTINVRQDNGLDGLRAYLTQFMQQYKTDEVPLLTSDRHASAAQQAADGLRKSLQALSSGDGLDIASVGLRYALDCLGQITGETTTDDVIDQIFARFCVGK